MHRIGWLVVVCLVTSCGERRLPVVGIIPKDAGHVFWQTVHAGSIKAAGEFQLEVEWTAPTLQMDAIRQAAAIDSLVRRRVAGIVLAPSDPQALAPAMDRAVRAGIPVVVAGSEVNMPGQLACVGSDSRAGGQIAARALGQLLFGEGRVVVLASAAEAGEAAAHIDGFAEELKRRHPKIQIAGTVAGIPDRAKARAVTDQLIDAHPDLRGLFADGETSSAGAVLALKGRGNSRVRTVVFAVNDELVSDLGDRIIDGIVVENPFKIGYESVRAIGQKLRGEKPPARIDSGVRLVTRMDLENPDVVELLHPDIQTWLSRARR